jgi:glutathione S-transferase
LGKRTAKPAAARVDQPSIAGPHNSDQIPALVERSKLRVKDFNADLNARLTEDPFAAGNHFSAADITALVTVDFATKGMSFPTPGEHRALNHWCEKVSSRPGAKA